MCTVGKSAAPPSFGETSAGRAHIIYLDATSFTITHAGAYKELPRSTVVRDRGLDPVHRGLLRLMESVWGECCVFGAHPSWARAAPPGAGAGGLGPGATPLPLCGFAGLERRRLMAPFSLQVWGRPLLRAAAAGRHDPAPVWCTATRRRGSLLAGRSRDARALRAGGDSAAADGSPLGARGGPPSVCSTPSPPGSPTARCVRCAGMLFHGLHLWIYACLVLQWCQWEWDVGLGQPSVGCRCYAHLRDRRTTSTGCY